MGTAGAMMVESATTRLGVGPVESGPVVVFVVCHQTKYLDLVLAGLSRQTRRPDRVVLSSDTAEPGIGGVARAWASRVGAPISWVRREHHGVARCSQVRNNAARHVIFDLGIRAGRLIQLDGDMLATPTLVERHEALGRECEMVFPYRVEVSRECSAALDAEAVARGGELPPVDEGAKRKLAARARRYRRHLFWRRFGLVPDHKPKLIGCNWSASIGTWLRINGFDEHYQGWGYLDDEFARRAVRAGARTRPAVEEIVAFHLWHTTRQPSGRLSDNPNHRRFMRRDLPVSCENGLLNPIAQNAVSVTEFTP